MKHLKVTTGILTVLFVSLSAMACKNQNKETNTGTTMQNMPMNHQNMMDMPSKSNQGNTKTSTQKNGETGAIIDAYIQIKNALVSDDSEKAAKGATALLQAFSNFNMSQLDEAQHKTYMDIVADAKENAEHISKSPLEHQREHFESLSSDINDLVGLLGTDKTLYQDYCPMAKASWLSETKDIKNPYYGSKMLTCGTIKKQIN